MIGGIYIFKGAGWSSQTRRPASIFLPLFLWHFLLLHLANLSSHRAAQRSSMLTFAHLLLLFCLFHRMLKVVSNQIL